MNATKVTLIEVEAVERGARDVRRRAQIAQEKATGVRPLRRGVDLPPASWATEALRLEDLATREEARAQALRQRYEAALADPEPF